MRVELSEAAMYRRMDKKERCMVMMPLCGMVVFGGVILMAAGYPLLMCLALSSISAVGLIASGIKYQKLKRLIMPVSRCFLEVEGACFSVVQPWTDERYESCRIELEDIERLVKAKRGSFYVKIHPERRSRIQDGSGRMRTIICVRPFGYETEQIEAIYQRIKERLPKTAEVYEYET